MAGAWIDWNPLKKRSGPELAFGTKSNRKMFPTHSVPTRIGIEQLLCGDPYRAPGCYGPDPRTLFLHKMDDRNKNKKGGGFGVLKAQRVLFDTKEMKPGPADYELLPDICKPSGKRGVILPFGSACSRFQAQHTRPDALGPGSFDHDVSRQRHVTYEESFGGARQVKGPVPVKCTMGVPDKMSEKDQKKRAIKEAYMSLYF